MSAKLHLLHTFDLGKDVSSMQTGPVVIDGIMYFTTDTVTYAINAATGKLKWKWVRPVKEPSQLRVNRVWPFTRIDCFEDLLMRMFLP